MASSLEAILIPFQSQINSRETRLRLQKALVDRLKKMGFFRPKINISSQTIDTQQTRLLVRVDEGFPCTISEVQTTFRIPRSVSLPIRKGDLCDFRLVESGIKEFEGDLSDEGYNQYKIGTPRFSYQNSKNTAILKIDGTIGQKVFGKVISPLAASRFVATLTGDDLHTIDTDIVDPNSMKTEIIRKFRNQGYQDVKVSEPYRSTPERDEILYTFNVDPGPQYTINEVQLEGANSINRDEALEAMGLFSIVTAAPLLTDKIISDSMDILSNFYAEKGYWDAKIYFPKVARNPKTATAKIVFTIKEGRRRVFKGIQISGNKAISKEEITGLLDAKINDSLTWKAIIDFQQELKEQYRNLGFLYTIVKVDLLQSQKYRENQVTVAIIIEEKARVRFGPITVSGMRKTKDYVVDRELKITEGDWYSPAALDETRQSLLELGLFSYVTISPTVSSDFTEEKDVIPYTIYIKEAKPGQVSFGPGWSLQRWWSVLTGRILQQYRRYGPSGIFQRKLQRRNWPNLHR